jgi:hypothetical protein
MPETPLPNDPASRTPDGTILDQTPTLTPTETPSPAPAPASTDPTPAPAPAPETLLTTKEEPASAPEKYDDFKLPEGVEIKAETLKSAQELFKSLNLPQAAAQSLIDFHTAQLTELANAPIEAYNRLREEWQTTAKADPEIGPKLNQIRENLGRAYDAVGNPNLVAEFKSAMNLTGVGDNPAFIKFINALATKIIEPRHVSAGGPSSVAAPNSASPTAAKAFYPNL